MDTKSSLADSASDEISMRRGGQDEREGERDPILTELPVGFKFLPTEEELFAFFLKNKILSLPLPHTAIQDIDSKDLYKRPPSKLGMSIKFLGRAHTHIHTYIYIYIYNAHYYAG